jgi:glycosyltransferase involved in cell wall biosynthesis
MMEIPSGFRHQLRKLFAPWLEARRWKDGIAPRNTVKVFYGHDRVPGIHEVALGGIVKYQDLSTRFPNTTKGANVVYLVSSAPPPAIAALIGAAKNAGARVILNQNGVAYPAWYGEGWQRANEPLKQMMQAADYVVYQSAFCKKSADLHLGPCVSGWEILHNPVDTNVFVPGPTLPMERGPVLLVSGSHMQSYRVESAVRAFALLAGKFGSAKLLIAGHLGWRRNHEDAESEVRKLCRDLHIEDRVEVLGRYTQQQAVGILQSAHMLIHTKYNDPCPRMVVEAMACGLPVIYSDSGGTPELVGSDAGIGVAVPQGWETLHPPSPEKLSEAVGAVVGKYDAYRQAARRRAVEKFDVKSWLDRHDQIFSDQAKLSGPK